MLTQKQKDSVVEYAHNHNGGMVEFKMYSGIIFLMTLGEFERLLKCRNALDMKRRLSGVARKAVLKYPLDYHRDDVTADSNYRRPGNQVSFVNALGYVNIKLPARVKIPGYSLSHREADGKHIPYPHTAKLGLGTRAPNPPYAISKLDASKLHYMHHLTILQRMKEKWLSATNHPTGLFGIELEFCTEERFVEEVIMMKTGDCEDGCCPGDGPEVKQIVRRKLPAPRFRDIDTLIPGVKMKSDGSVHPCVGDAAEANLLIGPNGYGRLKKLCHEIISRGGFVNKTCGVHIHLDVRGIDRRVVGIMANKLYDAMPILKDLVPDSRLYSCSCEDVRHNKLYNHFCKIEKPSFDDDRYRAINLDSYRKFGTIEVRMGSGSLNPSKIWHWANTLSEISKAKGRFKSWEEFLTSNFPLYLRVSAVQRANDFRPNTTLFKERMNLISPGIEELLSMKYSYDNTVE